RPTGTAAARRTGGRSAGRSAGRARGRWPGCARRWRAGVARAGPAFGTTFGGSGGGGGQGGTGHGARGGRGGGGGGGGQPGLAAGCCQAAVERQPAGGVVQQRLARRFGSEQAGLAPVRVEPTLGVRQRHVTERGAVPIVVGVRRADEDDDGAHVGRGAGEDP